MSALPETLAQDRGLHLYPRLGTGRASYHLEAYETTVRAEHLCYACQRWIEAGQRAFRSVGIDSHFWSFYYCTECDWPPERIPPLRTRNTGGRHAPKRKLPASSQGGGSR